MGRESEELERAVDNVYRQLPKHDAVPAGLPPLGDGEPFEIDGLTVTAEIGRGGQGQVYEAFDPALDRRVAVKVLSGLRPSCLSDRGARFLREARIASRFNHPGLCGVYACSEFRGSAYIVMRFVDGPSLAACIAESRAAGGDGPVRLPARDDGEDGERDPVHRVLEIVEEAARALHVAHEAGVIHRDVKPANIMLERGRAVIVDFGFALHDDGGDASRLTKTSLRFGTAGYMAPEQIDSRYGPVDRRADVFALGATLHECLTLQRPFRRPTHDAEQRATVEEEPPALSRRHPSFSKNLVTVIEAALEKDLARRYGTALELAEDLRRIREGEPVHARPAGVLVKLGRWAGRHRSLAAAIAAALLLSTTFSAILYVRSRVAEARNRELVRLADERTLRDIELAAASLGPPSRAHLDYAEALESRADAVIGRLPDHEAALRELRGELERLSGPESAPPPAGSPSEVRIRRLERRRRLLREARGRSAVDVATLDNAVAAVDLELASARYEARLRPADESLRWQYTVLEKLVGRLRRFASSPDSPLRAIRRYARDCREIESRTVGDHADRWRRAIKDIASSRLYGGLAIEPQPGLVPLGADPESGLNEFLHWSTHEGPLPERTADEESLRITESTGVILVLVPGGVFTQGMAKVEDGAAGAPSLPIAHEVELEPYFIAKHEMTRAQWRRATGADPSRYDPPAHADLHPVNSVSWDDAMSVLPRIGLTLPTESQWERAARGGTTTAFWTGDEPRSLGRAANVADLAAARRGAAWPAIDPSLDDGAAFTSPVSMRPANLFGLHDVHGNVFEWCRDGFTPYEQAVRAPDDGELLLSRQTVKIIRGGSFRAGWRDARSGWRNTEAPTEAQHDLGVRPARALSRKGDG